MKPFSKPSSGTVHDHAFSASDRVVSVLKLAVVALAKRRVLRGPLQKTLRVLHVAVGAKLGRCIHGIRRLIYYVYDHSGDYLGFAISRLFLRPVFALCQLHFNLTCFLYELAVLSYQDHAVSLRIHQSLIEAGHCLKHLRSNLLLVNLGDDRSKVGDSVKRQGQRISHRDSADSAAPSSPVNASEFR
jgi:hypothetical protein